MRNTSFYRNIIIGCLVFLLASCGNDASMKIASLPQAKAIEKTTDKPFIPNKHTNFVFATQSEHLIDAAAISIRKIEELVNMKFNMTMTDSIEDNSIVLKYNKNIEEEGYYLNINEKHIMIEASDYAGTFYAFQWLYHSLLLQEGENFTFPAMKIKDYPSCRYRGAMLDVSRSFFTVQEVKGFIDLMAMHRLNHFHWHLTDDQGWRIEIKAYPELTRTGAWQVLDDKKRGGFYTQEEIREVINYAKERAITIIPEIDLPGHSSAVLASYPELGCTGGPYHVATQPGGVHRDILCLGNDKAWTFAKDVLKEVAELFPAEYVHIGGDEVPRDRWESCQKCQRAIGRFGLKDVKGFSAEDLLQSKFNEKMAIYLKSLGKNMIGWDEVLTEEIAPETVIMSWRGLGRGTKALKMGHPVVFSSNGHFYFNNYQTAYTEDEPESTGGFLPMSKVFEAKWITDNLTDEERNRILGVEACLWTSFVPDYNTLNIKMLPRLAAFADVAWGNEGRDYAEYLDRLPDMLKIYEKSGYAYAPHFFEIKSSYTSNTANKELNIELSSIKDATIYYTLDGSQPSRSSIQYTEPIKISQSCTVRAIAYNRSGLVSDRFEKEVKVNKATFADVKLMTETAPRYNGDKGLVLVDGVKSPAFCTSGQWVGYNPNPMVAIIDLGAATKMSKVCVSSFLDMSSYIMGIERLEVEVSTDGESFNKVAQDTYNEPEPNIEKKHTDHLVLDFDETEARYVKVSAYGFEALPAWHSGAGQKPFLFVDEIEIY